MKKQKYPRPGLDELQTAAYLREDCRRIEAQACRLAIDHETCEAGESATHRDADCLHFRSGTECDAREYFVEFIVVVIALPIAAQLLEDE